MMLDLTGRLSELNHVAQAWFILLADGTIKGTIILTAVILMFKFRRRPAFQTRHLILFLAVVSLMLIPLLTRGIFIPARAQIIFERHQVAETPVQQVIQVINEVKPPILIHTTSSKGSLATPQLPHWTTWLFLIWAIGVGFSGFKMFRRITHVHRLCHTARIPEGSQWPTMLNELKAKLRVWLPVKLKLSPAIQIPIMNGIFNPVILLPESTADWPYERLQAVLLHELSHIKRYDNLTQNIANLIAIVYWFNPLAWISLKLLKMNREYACDDLVLWTGIQPTTYASELLTIIRGLKTSPLEMKQVAMFATTKVEQRMVNILAENQNRKPLTKRKIIALIIIVTLTSVLLSLVSPIGFAATGNISDEEYQKSIERFLGVGFALILVPAPSSGEKNIEISGMAVDWPTFWPQKGIKGSITSPYSFPNHLGVDILSPEGTPIVATGNGTVVTAGWDNTYGNCVTIQHKVLHLQYPMGPLYPISSLYSKLEMILVHPGDVVRQGDIIGYAGNGESSVEPYFHYEIRYRSFVIDPEPFFKFQENVMKGMYPNSVGPYGYWTSSWSYMTDTHIYQVQTQ
jgi:beta-lactamase regulating signal transducer with metallopeptidase domain